MSISPVIFLIIYAICVFVFLGLAIVNMYHILRFGLLRAPSIIITFLFVVLFVGVVVATFLLLREIDWQQPLQISLPFLNTNEGY